MKVNLRIEDGGSVVELNNEGFTASIKGDGVNFEAGASWDDIKKVGKKLADVLNGEQLPEHQKTPSYAFEKTVPRKVELAN